MNRHIIKFQDKVREYKQVGLPLVAYVMEMKTSSEKAFPDMSVKERLALVKKGMNKSEYLKIGKDDWASWSTLLEKAEDITEAVEEDDERRVASVQRERYLKRQKEEKKERERQRTQKREGKKDEIEKEEKKCAKCKQKEPNKGQKYCQTCYEEFLLTRECYNCKKTGHLSKNCKSAKVSSAKLDRDGMKFISIAMNEVEESMLDFDDSEGRRREMLLDTGAQSITLLDEASNLPFLKEEKSTK
jgi:hypothetical protein